MLGLVQLLILAEIASAVAKHHFCSRKHLYRRLRDRHGISDDQALITIKRLEARGLLKRVHDGAGYVIGRVEEVDRVLAEGRRLCVDIVQLMEMERQ